MQAPWPSTGIMMRTIKTELWYILQSARAWAPVSSTTVNCSRAASGLQGRWGTPRSATMVPDAHAATTGVWRITALPLPLPRRLTAY